MDDRAEREPARRQPDQFRGGPRATSRKRAEDRCPAAVDLTDNGIRILFSVPGLVLATVASLLLTQVMSLPWVFDPVINIASFVFAAAIGVVFGYFPARRAARLDPIEALRHE